MDLPFKEKIQRTTEKEDPFWLEDPFLLINPMRVTEFVPLKDMTTIEKLNAVARFSIYLSLVMLLVYSNPNFVFIGIITLFLTYVMFLGTKDQRQTTLESFTPEDQEAVKEGRYGITGVGLPCKKPTQNNPFMNVLPTDYVDEPNRPPACSYDDPNTREEIENNFSHNLYRDIDDVWDKNNSQRQYYTNPSTTIPNDRESFQNWLFKPRYVCKDGDLMACQRWDDRYQHGKL